MENIFNNLFIFEIANNHQGSLIHGKKIIDELSRIAVNNKINAAVKFQYRQLETFIHSDFKKDSSEKHISRFLSTKLKNSEFQELIDYSKAKGLITIVTPFDEESVSLIEEHNVDIIKIASCSSNDWPLLNRISKSEKPIICSTGGLDYNEIDNVYSFFKKRVKKFALLYCVGIYPTPNENLNLNAISKYIERYPGISIGYSGHEDPQDTLTGCLASAKGATIFERHVGLATDEIKLNAYSMDPSQTENWVKAINISIEALGSDKTFNEDEASSMLSLQRGVYSKKKIKKGDLIKPEDIFFAMPCKFSQLDSGNFGKLRAKYIASKDYNINEAIYEEPYNDSYHELRNIIHEAEAILRTLRIKLDKSITAEISHHYGIEKFKDFGLFIINVFNLEYCKKIIIVFPGQKHPEQYHKKKQESFHILHGELDLILDGISTKLLPGEIVTIERGVKHEFFSINGCVFEEVSSTHFRNDSFYTDDIINKLDPMARKTLIPDFYV